MGVYLCVYVHCVFIFTCIILSFLSLLVLLFSSGGVLQSGGGGSKTGKKKINVFYDCY
jgi:hypothetical protein